MNWTYFAIISKLFILIVCSQNSLAGTDNDNDANTRLLLSRINLTLPGLERVKASAGNPSVAIEELLKYYRTGNPAKHPVDKNSQSNYIGHCASKEELVEADNALKHIFSGQSAYPPYFCGEDIDWGTSPVADKEWVWQLNRMGFWDAIGKAYWHSGDEKYAKAWAQQLIDWTRKNPNDNEHRYAWRSIEAGIRGYRWTALFQRFINSPSFTPEVLVAFLNSCYDHASFLMTKYSSGSNWGLMEAEGMAFIAITFPQFKDAEKWQSEAFRRLNEEIWIQVYPDGHQRELALGYHIGCINWFLRTYDLAKLNGKENKFSNTYLERIEKMCEVPMKISLPDGTHVPFGDDWAGDPGQHNDLFLEWASLFNRADFLYLATNGEKGIKPANTAFALPESGIYSMRSGWNKDAICFVLKCGPNGGFHCQPDNGTFDLYAGGRNLMPDGGCYIYSGDSVNRAWFRQTKVHKTLTLDNVDSKYAPRLLHWSTGKSVITLVIENDSYKDLTHRRAVFFVDNKYFIIIDEALGGAIGQIDLHFQLAPGNVVIDEDKFSVCSAYNDGWNVAIRSLLQEGQVLVKEEGQVSFRYTEKEPRPAFCYRLNKKSGGGVRFVTLVAPFVKGNIPNIDIKFLENSKIGDSSVQLEVKDGNNTRTIGYNL